ncbi:MFS transporter [Streptomyces apocyni]|uniref:MFS transporter n=1 Tax=Streptomyces apocyni TaxID=2654677 RepID=UPI0012EA66EB|nr:MFS transporter [Streptomyces apocyni]
MNTQHTERAEDSAARTETGRQLWRTLLTSRNFLFLWAAMLISSTGTFFLVLTVSAKLLIENDSGFSASAVFGFQWILPILLMGVIRRACEGQRLRRTVVVSELGGGLISLAIGVLSDHSFLTPLLACFLVRGLLEGITKTARVVYTRQLFNGPLLKPASYVFNTSMLLGGGAGGVLGSVLGEHVSVLAVGALSAAAFTVSACCYAWLPQVSAGASEAERRPGTWAQVRGALRGQQRLALSVVYFVIAVGVLQGFHNVARTVIPVRVLDLGSPGVMNVQVIGGTALLLGAVAVPALLPWLGTVRRLSLWILVAAAVAMGLAPHAVGASSLYVSYFAYLFLFEFLFITSQAQMIQDTAPDKLVALTTFTNAVGTTMMIAITLLAGALSDIMDFGTVGVALAGLVSVTGCATELIIGRAIRKEGPVVAVR